MVTIKDISKACGVSPSTVSKVLNGYSDISQKTADLVYQTALSLGYTPNAAARLLKTNRSQNIGVLFVDQMRSGLSHEYFSGILNSLKEEAEAGGYDVTFISQNLGGRSMSFLEHCRYRKCDGVIIACVEFSDPAVLELVNSDIPVVTIDHVFDQRGAVVSDNVQGMIDLVNYIYEQGHRDVAFIHGEMTSVTRNRLAGFHTACERLGLRVPDAFVKQARYHDPDSSARATRELLSEKKRPTCIIYPDDWAAPTSWRPRGFLSPGTSAWPAMTASCSARCCGPRSPHSGRTPTPSDAGQPGCCWRRSKSPRPLSPARS